MANNWDFSLLPDLESFCSLFDGAQRLGREEAPRFSALRPYGGGPIEEATLYLITEASDYPRDEGAWISPEPLTGQAPHILCPGYSTLEILEKGLTLLGRFRSWELQLNELCFQNRSLDELCQLGTEILENLVCVHDGWFILIGKCKDFSLVLDTELVMSSQRDFLPRSIIDAFSGDSEYLATYTHHGPHYWKGEEGTPDSLYVNLWNDTQYLGRLLVVNTDRPICHRDFLIAEALAQRACYLLRSKTLSSHSQRISLDEILFTLLNGQTITSQELSTLMNLLDWSPNDTFITIRIQAQQAVTPDPEWRMLHNDLFGCYPGGYILFSDTQQVVILNQTKHPRTGWEIHHALAPLCRDYCLYAGFSSPVQGLQALGVTYQQAAFALEKVFALGNENWILPFEDSILDYLTNHLSGPLTLRQLIAPELLALQKLDREKGTSYYETLKQYLLWERDIPKAAEALIIHRTTLLYRLKKIQSLLNLRLEDPWYRLTLLLSTWILERHVDGG